MVANRKSRVSPIPKHPENLTRQRTLHVSTSPWADATKLSLRTRRSPSRRRYDVVIIGAGISGALMAHALADGSRTILVVDRQTPVHGSTLASTSMLQHELDVPLSHLAKMVGPDHASRAWLRSARAVDRLVEIVQDLRINCGLTRKKTLFLAGDEYGARTLKAEVAARRSIGLKADFLTGRDLRDEYGIDRTGAIASHVSASANPAQMAAGLLRASQRSGVEIVAETEISDVLSSGKDVILSTSTGDLIAAEYAVFCTGYEFVEAVARKNHSIISTWAIASKPGIPIPAWVKDHLVWEGSDPYLYLRCTQDGRLIVGGEDERDPEAYRSTGKLERKAKIIAEKVSDLLDVKIGRPDYAWAAPFGVTPTGLPMIGEIPGLPQVFVVMGFGGNGITYSQIAAEIVSNAINGHADSDADLYDLKPVRKNGL